MDHKEVLHKIQDYIRLLEGDIPPILQDWEEHFPFSPSSERGLGVLLLYASLLQGISERALANWIHQWYSLLGESLLESQNLPYDSLYAVCSSVKGFANWKLSQKAVGIVRSVGDYIQQKKQETYNGLSTWTKQFYGTEEGVQELAQNIFYMGKKSLTKPKPYTFFWLYIWATRTGNEECGQEKEIVLPVTAGGRSFIRAIQREAPTLLSIWVSQGTSWEIGSVEELKAYNCIMRGIFPKEPWKAQHPISLYKRRGMDTLYKCQEQIGGCEQCPMNPICYKKTF